jgi:glycosyltransferase involved in cell wall biosynthesis
MNPPPPARPLCLAVLGDLDGPHTQRWLRAFVQRGHDVHAISYYPPREPPRGVTLHVLQPVEPVDPDAGWMDEPPRTLRRTAPKVVERHTPRSFLRIVHALRYRRAGLKRILNAIRPDVFHAHYVVEHGFYGALAGIHPYVVSAWGSDLLVDSYQFMDRQIARLALRHADIVTANDAAMAARAIELGVPAERVHIVRLGIDAAFLQGPPSVNLEPRDLPPTIISDRALEPLYNVDVVLRAFASVRQRLPEARLLVAHEGSQRVNLEALAGKLSLGDSVRWLGKLTPEALRDALAGAHAYVSVPSSDSLSLSTREAMAAGAFPVVSELPSQDGWIEHGVNGLRVPPRNVGRLADALETVLRDSALRRRTVELNRARIQAEDVDDTGMLAMEQLYYQLAGRRPGPPR